MEEAYDHKKVEPKITSLWEKGDYFAPQINPPRKPYSMFLAPPNASGPMHIGNALMIAVQDILARYHRAKGEPTLWVPGTDHAGYETQVTFERELEEKGETKDSFNNKELVSSISAFVNRNNETIVRQIKAMGASVDWSRFRFTLDEPALAFVGRMFKKMIADKLIYRSSYMVNYCTSCATVLADIELKEVETSSPLYFIKFPFQNGGGYLPLATTRPEFLFAVTHLLVHPQDARFAQYIGTELTNPATGESVHVVKSNRKFDPKNPEPFLFAFTPSHKKYDFEYAIRNTLPVRNLLDWEGAMVERHVGVRPEDARKKEIGFLREGGFIERIDDEQRDVVLLCKKGHPVQGSILMTWFMRLDDEKTPIRKPALDAIKKEGLIVYPRWREKGLVEWIGKMHDWPIARQNVWGIRIPIWYEIIDPALFTVWFFDKEGTRRHGNLQTFLDGGISLEEITEGLQRIYAEEGCAWTLEKEEGKLYLPETDTFDTWFSSCVWGVLVYEDEASKKISNFYPSSVVVTGYDLLRLFIARTILLSQYLTGKLPFKRVYFHSLLKSKDGQKMSKSLGNAVTLDEYLEKFGADVTRMALVSYTGLKEDFYFSDESLEFYKTFSERLWKMGRMSEVANTESVGPYKPERLSAADRQLLSDVGSLGGAVGADVEKYFLAQAQEKLVSFLLKFEEYVTAIYSRDDAEQALAVFNAVFKEYLSALHPFMPFMTEQLYVTIYKPQRPLAATLTKFSGRR